MPTLIELAKFLNFWQTYPGLIDVGLLMNFKINIIVPTVGRLYMIYKKLVFRDRQAINPNIRIKTQVFYDAHTSHFTEYPALPNF